MSPAASDGDEGVIAMETSEGGGVDPPEPPPHPAKTTERVETAQNATTPASSFIGGPKMCSREVEFMIPESGVAVDGAKGACCWRPT